MAYWLWHQRRLLCSHRPITAVQGVSIYDADDKAVETINLKVGEEIALTAKITPSDATNKNVKWSSSDEKIAEVDANGKITGVSAGTATITVTTEDGGHSSTVEATVTANDTDNTPPADDENIAPPPPQPEDDPAGDTVNDPSNNANNNNTTEEEIVEDDNTKIKATITPVTTNDIGKVTIAIDENVTLTAPKGFDKYTWYIDDVKVKEAEESVKKSKELKFVVDRDTKTIKVDGTETTIEEGLHSVMLIVNDELSATYYLEIKKQTTGGNV